jgi:hypothetical protein
MPQRRVRVVPGRRLHLRLPPHRRRGGSVSTYEAMARAFQIFAEYSGHGRAGISAEHDVIYAGPDPSVVSEEHLMELAELFWLPEPEFDTFRRFT